jgi:hypothetical protein
MLISRKASRGLAAAVIALGLLRVSVAAEEQPANDVQSLKQREGPPGRRIREFHFSPDGRVRWTDGWTYD